MRNIKDPILFQSVRKFLTEDMPIIRKKSTKTVESYRYTLNIYLTFLCQRYDKTLSAVTIKDFSQSNILNFMDAHICPLLRHTYLTTSLSIPLPPLLVSGNYPR